MQLLSGAAGIDIRDLQMLAKATAKSSGVENQNAVSSVVVMQVTNVCGTKILVKKHFKSQHTLKTPRRQNRGLVHYKYSFVSITMMPILMQALNN